MSLRIGFVSMHTSPLETPGSGDAGGMNVHVLALAGALVRRGHRVEIMTRRAGTEGPHATRLHSGVLVHHLDAGAAGLRKEELPTVTTEFAERLAGLGRFDVLHSHYWLSAVPGGIAARRTGAAHVVSLHTVAGLKNRTLAPGDRPEPSVRLDAERSLVRESDAVIASSKAERTALIDFADARPGRIEIVSPGVDSDLFRVDAPAPSWLVGAAEGRPIVTVLARIQPLKGQDLALDAIARIPAQDRPLLVLAGGASPGHQAFEHALRRRAEESGVRVVLPGALERADAAGLLAASALVLVPSHSETFGLVALEAAATGTAVVAASGSGLDDAVARNSGVLLGTRDPETWSRAVRRLLGDPDLRAELGGRARAHAVLHSWDRTAERAERVYLRALDTRANESGP